MAKKRVFSSSKAYAAALELQTGIQMARILGREISVPIKKTLVKIRQPGLEQRPRN